MENKKSIFIRVSPEECLPEKHGNYLVTLEYPNKSLVVKKAFFINEFKLRNGTKNCKIINWFKRIEINNELYEKIVKENIH